VARLSLRPLIRSLLRRLFEVRAVPRGACPYYEVPAGRRGCAVDVPGIQIDGMKALRVPQAVPVAVVEQVLM
jgi:hypothetical protein